MRYIEISSTRSLNTSDVISVAHFCCKLPVHYYCGLDTRSMRLSTNHTAVNIHSFCRLSYDRSTAPSKASPVHSAIQYFVFQFPVSLLLLENIQLLRQASSSSFRHFYPTFYSLFCWLNAAFTMAILDLVLLVHLALSVTMLFKYLKCSTFCVFLICMYWERLP